MASDSELGWSDYLEIIPNKYKYKYKDEPDNFKISVGDWKSDSDGWPEFRAFMGFCAHPLEIGIRN
ncbi:hypothetical protein CW735_09770 [Alteromonas sp. MB-3u-76]|jgi:hypothetical protein|uniref:hypothetical protein n=1 Tax=Alteromonas sp. MB-3u-76 TaxID=2058133 RepID=UPI000C302399|nr:hypothetical protein [Alteromonas sp. MB-3u-76]AUC88435.1 hypothetical protein CW735_09770 [Alteromonas sp. MB-3u-76]